MMIGTTTVSEGETVEEMIMIGAVPDQDLGLEEGGLVPDPGTTIEGDLIPRTETTIEGGLVPGRGTMVEGDLDHETETTTEGDPVPGTGIGGGLAPILETGTMTGGGLAPVLGAKGTLTLLRLLRTHHTFLM